LGSDARGVCVPLRAESVELRGVRSLGGDGVRAARRRSSRLVTGVCHLSDAAPGAAASVGDMGALELLKRRVEEHVEAPLRVDEAARARLRHW
jgi:hypothetical protein